ncbi:hypothetical protein OHB12_09300 [Nocardia sp. NBC_01730]|uniref:hypothetical protein n=1 Tax=Nocardia sp. NBC_01730 TaxID=2975998 RepID=UPI002E10CC00|nr:hypothetical protein OHB12_09300 [Nocardia sp. NBC_01730]
MPAKPGDLLEAVMSVGANTGLLVGAVSRTPAAVLGQVRLLPAGAGSRPSVSAGRSCARTW